LDMRQACEKQGTRRRYALQKLDSKGLQEALEATGWQHSTRPLESLQEALETHLPRHCPKAKPSERARLDWSPHAAELLAGARRARCRYTITNYLEDRQDSRRLSNQLRREIKRVSYANWRNLVSTLIADQKHGKNKGLWRLSKWSRRTAGRPHTDPHIPPLRRREEEQSTEVDAERVQILAEKFFPPPLELSLTTAGASQPIRILEADQLVSQEEVQRVLNHLPSGKAPDPDGIPNEVLRILGLSISEGLAQAISSEFAGGTLPARYKESVTITLRKEGKKDYSLPGSYRPIALKNTLAKVVEKVIANRLSQITEEHDLLPWTQMGARKNRSTLSTIGLITVCVQTAWRARPGCVVSMLSLDLAGAFNNVPHSRLLEILRLKGLPSWLTDIIASFMQDRRT
jgi:Reverse transcriptase (RNA-dependent DNA polymerase)